jgi:hypothetical protein
VAKVLPSPHVTYTYPTPLLTNPDQTQAYFDLMNRGAQNQAEHVFQQEEFRNTLHLLNQVEDRHLYLLHYELKLIIVVSKHLLISQANPYYRLKVSPPKRPWNWAYLHKQYSSNPLLIFAV